MAVAGVEQLWSGCAELLRARVAEGTWRTWFEAARPVALDDERLVLSVPSSLVKERIETRYLDLVQEALEAMGAGGRALVLQVRPDSATESRDRGVDSVTAAFEVAAEPAGPGLTPVGRGRPRRAGPRARAGGRRSGRPSY